MSAGTWTTGCCSLASSTSGTATATTASSALARGRCASLRRPGGSARAWSSPTPRGASPPRRPWPAPGCSWAWRGATGRGPLARGTAPSRRPRAGSGRPAPRPPPGRARARRAPRRRGATPRSSRSPRRLPPPFRPAHAAPRPMHEAATPRFWARRWTCARCARPPGSRNRTRVSRQSSTSADAARSSWCRSRRSCSSSSGCCSSSGPRSCSCRT
mmetsp:Transcript_56230/g.174798  ORF Transcript_56230/g.174798 Transcript_56230/m.174798 type:complete len:215 (-) Transcript_56230:1101-1745(-)